MDPGPFLQFARALPEATFLVSEEGCILAANQAACEMLERPPHSLCGLRVAELVADPPDKLESYLRGCARSREHRLGSLAWRTAGNGSNECRCEGALLTPRSDYSPALLLLRCRPKEVTTSRFLALNDRLADLAREITHRKRAEAALYAEREWFRTTLSSIGDAVIVTDAQGRITFMNAVAHELTGWGGEDAAGQELETVFRVVHEQTREAIENPARRVLREKAGSVLGGDPVLIRKDGSERPIDESASPIRDLHGNVTGVVLVFRDVTERKKAAEQFRQTQKLESLGLLAGGVAHDFNNLLTGILGNASLALETLAPGDPAFSIIEEVVRASQRASELTRQMLAYAGKGRFTTRQIDVGGLIREISSLIHTSIPKWVRLELALEDGLPPIHADSSQIQQLVMNLVINGAEAVPEGQSGTVVIKTGLQHVADAAVQSGSGSTPIAPGVYVSIEVRDTGSGMDEATKSKIFDPFFTTKFAGRGLGLAATLGIVRGHKGAITVESSPGQGSTFRVLLPASTPAEQPGDADEVQTKDLSGTGLVLVVDDEEVVRRTAKAALQRYGYSVVVARDGREAVEVFRSVGGRVALVLLDMTMPVMSGEETLDELQSLRPGIRVVLSSGYNELEALRRFDGKKLAGFIQKPYTS